MSFNLLDTVKTLFTSDLVGKISSSLGESEGGTQKAISAAIPSVLTGLLNKAGSGGGASSILSMAKEASNSGILGNLGGLLGGGSSMSSLLGIAGNLFGDKVGGIAKLISGFAGIKESSASSLLNLAAPAAMAGLGKHAVSSNMDAGGLLSMLSSQKDSILSAIPSGLNLAGALGLGSLGDIGGKLSSALSSFSSGGHSSGSHTTPEGKSSNKWIGTILGTAAVIALGLFLFKQCGNGADKKETATEIKEEPKTETVKEEVKPATTPEVYKVTLPDGVVLQANKGGIEDKLVGFLGTNWKALGADSLKKVWFDFDNLNFETGSAKLTAESSAQIANIAAILKAFPAAKFKVGGYTDKVGNEAANKKLSQDRANATVAAIKAAGANAAQLLDAEGYGSAFATVAATASDEERRKDRRIAISVRE